MIDADNAPAGKKGFFSDKKFTDLQICDPLKEALRACSFTTMTDIQAKAIPLMLKGKDVLEAMGRVETVHEPPFHRYWVQLRPDLARHWPSWYRP